MNRTLTEVHAMAELPPSEGAAPVYVVTCLYGLERVLAREVRDVLGAEAERHWCEVAFGYGGAPEALRRLRVAGNVFLRLDRFEVGPGADMLAELRRRLPALPLDDWEAVCARMQELPSSDVSVTVSRKGEHPFTYAQVEELALEVLTPASGRRVSLDPAPLELRIEIRDQWCRLLGRLTTRPLSARDYRRFHMRGATDPSLAAAMVELSGPQPDDVFLDPFCGTGTLPIERALLAPAARVLAGDIRPGRAEWTMANARAAGVGLSAACWDAADLPLPDRSVTRLVTVPPQSDPAGGKPWAAEALAALLGESLRVLAYGGRLVWLMQRGALFDDALKLVGARWRPKRMECNWRGRPWVINTLHKRL